MSEELVRELLETYGEDYTAIAMVIFDRRDRALSISFISTGVQKYAKDIRQKERREIKLDRSFQKFEEFETVPRPHKKGPAIPLSEARIEQGMKLAGIFVKWKIGGTAIRDVNKAGLLKEAENERKSGQGHFDNALIYEMVARPMNDTETVGQHYRNKISEIERLYTQTTKSRRKRGSGGDEARV